MKLGVLKIPISLLMYPSEIVMIGCIFSIIHNFLIPLTLSLVKHVTTRVEKVAPITSIQSTARKTRMHFFRYFSESAAASSA